MLEMYFVCKAVHSTQDHISNSGCIVVGLRTLCSCIFSHALFLDWNLQKEGPTKGSDSLSRCY